MGMKKMVKILGHDRTINTGLGYVHVKEGALVELEFENIKIFRSLINTKQVEVVQTKGTVSEQVESPVEITPDEPPVEITPDEPPVEITSDEPPVEITPDEPPKKIVEYLVKKKGSEKVLKVFKDEAKAKKYIKGDRTPKEFIIESREV